MTHPAEPRRSSLILIPLVDALDELDVDVDALLEEHGLDRQRIRDVGLRLPLSVVFELFRQAEKIAADPTIGVRAGLAIRPGAFDVYDYAVRSSATLGDAGFSAIRLAKLLDDTYQPSLFVDGDRAFFEYHRSPGEPDSVAEFMFAAVVEFSKQMTGVLLTASRLAFRRTDGADPARFAALLGQEPEFGAPLDVLEFPVHHLALPLRTADPGLHKVLGRHAEELMARLPKLQGLSGRVRDLILRELQGGNPGIVTVAEKLGTTARTLRRRLADEGTTHQALLDELRKSLADRYLRESIPVAQAAVLLGFSTAPSFHRAFRRWYGTTPERYRSR
jgi:AraC-like DNA-binding protein